MQPNTTTVRPSFLRLLASFGVMAAGGGGAVYGFALLSGLGTTQTLAAAWGVVAALALVLLVLALATQTPQVVIGPEGFAFRRLIGALSRKWQEVDGPFAVIRLGWSKAVAYRLTAECKARLGKKPTARFSGYDEVLPAAVLQLSAERLAELLNETRQRSLPAASEPK